jgi:NAD(P)-dependent dehydrogenase (short-subunit alcohol dehydrogenase family)
MSPERKVFIIAGASGGLGQAVVPVVVQSGAMTVSIDRHAPVQVAPGHHALTGDVTDERDVQRLMKDALAATGRIDGLINLVGAFAPGRTAETEEAAWHRMLSLNLTAAFFLSKAVVPHLIERRNGRIIHIAARAALDPFPGAAAYIAAKSGLIGLIRALALELAGTGVTVNGVLPTTIDTPANRAAMPTADVSRWVKPEAIGRLLVFLASEEAGAVTGALIPIGSP